MAQETGQTWPRCVCPLNWKSTPAASASSRWLGWWSRTRVKPSRPSARSRRVFRLREAGVGLVIAEDGPDGRLDAPEFLLVAAFRHRAQAPVDDVAANEHEVRFLRVDEVHPAGEFRPTVVVPDVQVAGQDERERLFQGLIRLQRQFLTVFVRVMDGAQRHDERHEADRPQQSRRAVLQERLGQEVAEGGDIGQEEHDQQVQEGDHPGIAHLVKHGRELDGDAFREGEAQEHRRHPEQEQTCHGQLPPGRRNPPQVPADVTRQGDDDREDGEESGPHG